MPYGLTPVDLTAAAAAAAALFALLRVFLPWNLSNDQIRGLVVALSVPIVILRIWQPAAFELGLVMLGVPVAAFGGHHILTAKDDVPPRG